MTALILLALSPAHADDVTVLEGKRCDPRGTCTQVSVELYDSGRLLTSDGLSGTYTVPADRTGHPSIAYVLGTARGTMNWGPENCWQEATSPLNPDLGSINVCLTAEAQVLRPYSITCENFNYSLGPVAGEDGHWSAGRLTPEQSGGMWIHDVTYAVDTVDPTIQCTAMSQRVQLFVGDAASPPTANPLPVHDVIVDVQPGDDWVTVELPEPLFVDGDESLWVSVQHTLLPGGDRTCASVCVADGLIGDRSFWSNSATTPYAWQDLNDWNIEEMIVKASGMVAAP